MKYEQTYEELKCHLRDQIHFLRRSCEAFDQGYDSEAKRISVVMRVLLHNSRTSVSLMRLLNREDILFYDTSLDYNPNNLAPTTGLVMLRLGGGRSGFIAPLDNGSPIRYKRGKVIFKEWWKKIIIANTKKALFMTREDVVLHVSCQDGGAHVDRKLDKAYADLTRFDILGWVLNEGGIQRDVGNDVVFASIRQMGHEVIKSIKDEFPECC